MNSYVSLLSFHNPRNYWEALTLQTHCMSKESFGSFPYFSRVKNNLPVREILSVASINTAFVSEEFLDSYSNSLLETAYHLFCVGAFFRVCEIIGYRAKSDILKNTPKKYAPVIHIGFEAIFLLTTALVCDILIISHQDYMHAKMAEYVFRGVGYAMKSKYSIMDYAAEVNLVNMKDKHTMQDFVALKFIMFTKNYLATFFIHRLGATLFYDEFSEQSKWNGIGALINDKARVFTCNHNLSFVSKYHNFINFVQEIGLFSGALAVDVSLTGLKQIGFLKDPNNFTIDPNYRNNIRVSMANAMERMSRLYAPAAPKERIRGASEPLNQQVFIPEVGKVPIGGKRRVIESQAIERPVNYADRKFVAMELDLSVGIAVIDNEKLNRDASKATFVWNIYKGIGSGDFDNVLAQSDIVPLKLLTVKAGNGDNVYELQHKGRDHRLLGKLYASTAMDNIPRLSVNELLEKKVAFERNAELLGKTEWQCVVLTTYAAKHKDIARMARAV